MDTPEMGEVKAGTSELGELRRVWGMCHGGAERSQRRREHGDSV